MTPDDLGGDGLARGPRRRLGRPAARAANARPQGHVEQSRVFVVTAEHLHADGKPVDVPAGIDTAGLP